MEIFFKNTGKLRNFEGISSKHKVDTNFLGVPKVKVSSINKVISKKLPKKVQRNQQKISSNIRRDTKKSKQIPSLPTFNNKLKTKDFLPKKLLSVILYNLFIPYFSEIVSE